MINHTMIAYDRFARLYSTRKVRCTDRTRCSWSTDANQSIQRKVFSSFAEEQITVSVQVCKVSLGIELMTLCPVNGRSGRRAVTGFVGSSNIAAGAAAFIILLASSSSPVLGGEQVQPPSSSQQKVTTSLEDGTKITFSAEIPDVPKGSDLDRLLNGPASKEHGRTDISPVAHSR